MACKPGLAPGALAGILVVTLAPLLPAAPFIRGDRNGDTVLDLSDPIATLLHLFQGGNAPSCRDAGDANDDGQIDIADALYTLNFLFTGGQAPGFPHPFCDEDPSLDDLDCAEYTCPPVENHIVAIRSVEAGVEIELSSSRAFAIRALYPALCIGDALESPLSRHPADSLNTIIFSLTREEFDRTRDGDPVTVEYGGCNREITEMRPYWDLWVFGPLDKSLLDA
jgi:hypothetical protein